MFGIGSDGAQRLGGNLKQQPVDYRLVVIRDRGNRCWQGEDYVVVVHRQQFALAGLQPMSRGSPLALRAVPVTAGVIGDLVMRTGFAAQDMSTQCRAAALLDGRHDLELSEAQ